VLPRFLAPKLKNVTVRRVRLTSAVGRIYWVSAGAPHTAKGNNINVLRPYSEAMRPTLRPGGTNTGRRPSRRRRLRALLGEPHHVRPIRSYEIDRRSHPRASGLRTRRWRLTAHTHHSPTYCRRPTTMQRGRQVQPPPSAGPGRGSPRATRYSAWAPSRRPRAAASRHA
jgi:hypothetical protein